MGSFRWLLLELGLLLHGATLQGAAQCPTRTELWQTLETATQTLPDAQLVPRLEVLKHQCEACRFVRDSLYAKVLHTLGRSYWQLGQLDRAKAFTKAAIRVNSLPDTGTKPANRANSYSNLGNLCVLTGHLAEAEAAFHQALACGKKYPEKSSFIPRAYLSLANLSRQRGDLQQCIRYTELGEASARQQGLIGFQFDHRIERAQAFIHLDQPAVARTLLREILPVLQSYSDTELRGFALTMLAEVEAKTGQTRRAIATYQQALVLYENLLKSATTAGPQRDNTAVVAMNLANVYLVDLKDFSNALRYYFKARSLAQDAFLKAKIMGNAASVYRRAQQFEKAVQSYQHALTQAPIGFKERRPEANPSAETMRRAVSKTYLLTLMQGKADAWLAWGKVSGNRTHLKNALTTYLTADQMVDFMRWEHIGEGSKKFWRQKTHELYEAAIETCHRLNDPKQAFYFFEKSRAALLSDRLNELGASQLLDAVDKKQETDLQTNVTTLRQQLGEAKPGDKRLSELQQKLLTTEDEQAAFIRSLESKNPAYFRLRYDTSAVTLQQAREKLLTSNQTLLEYFVGDSATYALTLTATTTTLVRLDAKTYSQTARQLLALSADAGALNRQFSQFLTLSHRFYRDFFQGLDVPKGRVIVSPDGAVVPLDLLSRSATQPDWLLADYAFSYTYSARLLVKQPERSSAAAKSFLGLAPVAFASGQSTLGGSDASLNAVASGFSSPTLLIGSAATKRAFLREIPRHRIVQLYAHAQADSTGAEPLVYFADSTLKASELSTTGLLPTQLVVLSACQTGVGQATRGEGVFSLARSLAGAGVPATVTTLWRVNDQATYRLTELFYQKLGEGMPKDEALQEAKREFLKSATGTQRLPALWAGMVLIGEAAPLQSRVPLWAWAGGGAGLLLMGVIAWRRRKNRSQISSALSS